MMHFPKLVLCAAALCATQAQADMAKPMGDVILTVTGAIGLTNSMDRAEFDADMLAALPVTEFTTSTIWTEGEATFTGVSLAALLSYLQADGSAVSATAINDYAVEIPVSDAVEGGAMVAYLLDGAPMSVRDKGPLWVVYPYDTSPEYQTEVIYSRSIWQLDRIDVTN